LLSGIAVVPSLHHPVLAVLRYGVRTLFSGERPEADSTRQNAVVHSCLILLMNFVTRVTTYFGDSACVSVTSLDKDSVLILNLCDLAGCRADAASPLNCGSLSGCLRLAGQAFLTSLCIQNAQNWVCAGLES